MSVVCSLSVEVFSYRLHLFGGFWFDIFRLLLNLVVSTYSTKCDTTSTPSGCFIGYGWMVLVGGAGRWTVVEAFYLYSYHLIGYVPTRSPFGHYNNHY